MKRSFPIISYLIYIALAVYLLLLMQAELNALPEQGGSVSEDIGIGLTEGFTKVFMIIVGAYGALAIVALLVKIMHIGLRFWLVGLISALFDLAFLVIHGGLLVYVAMGEGTLSMPLIPLAALAAVSLVSFIVGALTVSD